MALHSRLYPGAGSDPNLAINEKQITLKFGPQEPLLTPPIGPAVRNPAAYVLLHIARKSQSGSIVAEGFYLRGTSMVFLDRAAVGAKLDEIVPVAARQWLIHTKDMQWLRSGAERHLSLKAIEERNTAFADKHLGRVGSPDTWKMETLILHSGLLEHIVISGQNAVLLNVEWMPSRLYSELRGWQDVDHFYLPLTNAPSIYPAWSPKLGAQIANERLHLAPPRALPPWSDPTVPPLPAARTLIETDTWFRYLGSAFDRIEEAIRTFLSGDLAMLEPQPLVEIPQSMVWMDGSNPGGSNIPYRPFDFLYGAARRSTDGTSPRVDDD